MKEFLEKFANTKEGTWQSIAIAYGIKILLAVLILIIGFWLINRLVRFTDSFFKKRRVDNTVNSFFKNLITAGLKILMFIFVLNFAGIQNHIYCCYYRCCRPGYWFGFAGNAY